MDTKLKRIINHLKGKKNLGIDDNYVIEILSKYLKEEYFKELFQKDEKFIFKNKKFKELIKHIRNELYSNYGLYQAKRQWKKEELLKELETNKNLKKISTELLKLHTSSRERLLEYKYIYGKILEIIGKPKVIIDLACGLNPCSLILINFKGKCFCYDIGDEVRFLNSYFKITKKSGLDGEAFSKNITLNMNFKKGNVCFLFKFLDLVKNKTEFFKSLIKCLDCEHLVVSFSKKTISLKQMKNTERRWFIKLLNIENLEYFRFDTENEFFYVIKLK